MYIMARQAGAIEITQEMIEAADAALSGYQDSMSEGSYFPWHGPTIARLVYTAMRPLEPHQTPCDERACAQATRAQ
jgi:hypothetical protein